MQSNAQPRRPAILFHTPYPSATVIGFRRNIRASTCADAGTAAVSRAVGEAMAMLPDLSAERPRAFRDLPAERPGAFRDLPAERPGGFRDLAVPAASGPRSTRVSAAMSHLPEHACQHAAAIEALTRSLGP